MTTGELLAIMFVSACFVVAFCYILTEEKEEHGIFKTWRW